MKTILVPTDFSHTANNAAQYAIDFAKQFGANKIVLFNTFSIPVSVSPDPTASMLGGIDFKDLEKVSIEGLTHLATRLGDTCPADVEITTLSNYGYLQEQIQGACKETNADLVIMGITGGGVIAQKVVGSNTTSLAKTSPVPVLIIPSEVKYKHISRVLILSDFENVEATTPFYPVQPLLESTKAQLYVLHVAENSHHAMDEKAFECVAFKYMFAKYHPKFFFEVNTNFAETVIQFVKEQSIDILIVFPKKHGFLETLFVASHTKELAFNSNVAVLAAHA
jgi:nucleotide-binding universal stress UspA family protein